MYRDSRKVFDFVKVKVEVELNKVKKIVYELILFIEQLNFRLKFVKKLKIDGNGNYVQII